MRHGARRSSDGDSDRPGISASVLCQLAERRNLPPDAGHCDRHPTVTHAITSSNLRVQGGPVVDRVDGATGKAWVPTTSEIRP